MRSKITQTESLLLLACLGLVLVALLAPPLAQPSQYHVFADQRALWGLSNAMDVVSNAAFALAGIAGGAALFMLPARSLSNVQRAMAVLFFSGLELTRRARAGTTALRTRRDCWSTVAAWPSHSPACWGWPRPAG